MKNDKKPLEGKALLLDICNYPNKYRHVMNVPCWSDAARSLIEIGCRLGTNQLPPVMRLTLVEDNAYPIAKEANAKWNLQ